MFKKKFFMRYFLLLLIFSFAVFVYGGKLLNIQIANYEEYKYVNKSDGTYTRSYIVSAVRGEIYDRDGVPLVTNKNIYNLTVDGYKLSKSDKGYVRVIIDLLNLLNRYGGTIRSDSFPVISIENQDGSRTYAYSMTAVSSESNGRTVLNRFLLNNNLTIDESAEALVTFLTKKYDLDEYLPPEDRDPQFFRAVLGICYDFDRLKVLSGDYRYVLGKDINERVVTVIKEEFEEYPGAEIDLSYERVYRYPSVMPHLMGSVGPLTPEDLDSYLERGYSMDAIVGRGGVERAFEEYLRGKDGKKIRKYDANGDVIDEYWAEDSDGNLIEPVPGKNVYLTIDIKLQQVAEHSLAKTIDRIHRLSLNSRNPDLDGLDAFAGGAAVINPNNGEILAVPTYPSYSLDMSQEEIDELSKDDVSAPFLNRPFWGLYEPGSVFKIATSTAALCSGVLSRTERIYDYGKYTKYEGYQPSCWYYSMYGASHGNIEISEALKRSCNYFYFTVGERLQIDRLNEYARHLGLGVYTGVEVGETEGALYSPEYKEARGSSWFAGDLLQASIGQQSRFSPVQMVTMLGAVLNGGTRYATHLLLRVEEYGAEETYYAPEAKVLDRIYITDENLSAIKQGMAEVLEAGGTGASLFNNFPRSFTVGGKTGTAQVRSDHSDYATFVAFAPYANPEIAVSVVIERGSKGTWAGFTAEDVMSYYFGYKTFNQSMDLPDEPEEPETSETSETSEESAP